MVLKSYQQESNLQHRYCGMRITAIFSMNHSYDENTCVSNVNKMLDLAEVKQSTQGLFKNLSSSYSIRQSHLSYREIDELTKQVPYPSSACVSGVNNNAWNDFGSVRISYIHYAVHIIYKKYLPCILYEGHLSTFCNTFETIISSLTSIS